MAITAVVIAAIAAVGGLLAARDKRKQQKKNNQIAQEAAAQTKAKNVVTQATGLNPQLFGALSGEKGTTGYQNALYNIAQMPGYIDPSLMNAPLTMLAQQNAMNYQAGLSAIGRSGMEGGLGNAFQFSSQAALQRGRADILQNYALWRESQKRQDIAQINQMQAQYLQMASGNAGTTAQFLSQQQAPIGWGGIVGNGMIAGAAAYGSMRAPQVPQMGQQMVQQQQPMMQANNMGNQRSLISYAPQPTYNSYNAYGSGTQMLSREPM